ncbi:hypothetical protein FRB95_002450 [Tulasnella sp. JGI-2019a]|nr:hypothetical protein FRB95_002450 [Tulasnella sp. JGI-2019a]
MAIKRYLTTVLWFPLLRCIPLSTLIALPFSRREYHNYTASSLQLMRIIPILGAVGIIVSATPVLSVPTPIRPLSSVHQTDVVHVKRNLDAMFVDEGTTFWKIWEARNQKDFQSLDEIYHTAKAQAIDILERLRKGKILKAQEVENSKRLLSWFRTAGDEKARDVLARHESFIHQHNVKGAGQHRVPLLEGHLPKPPDDLTIKKDVAQSEIKKGGATKSKTGWKKIVAAFGVGGVIGTVGGVTAAEIIGNNQAQAPASASASVDTGSNGTNMASMTTGDLSPTEAAKLAQYMEQNPNDIPRIMDTLDKLPDHDGEQMKMFKDVEARVDGAQSTKIAMTSTGLNGLAAGKDEEGMAEMTSFSNAEAVGNVDSTDPTISDGDTSSSKNTDEVEKASNVDTIIDDDISVGSGNVAGAA